MSHEINTLPCTVFKAAAQASLLTLFFASRALAAGETSETRTIVEVGASQGAALGNLWTSRPSYSASLLSLGESGQGFGARLTLLPAPNPASAWELSADAVARFANESPWYVKGIGGIAVAPPSAWWPPHVRAGGEIGLTAIRGGIGLEAGIGTVVSFPPFRPAEGEVIVFAGVGILFGFGTPSPAQGASPSSSSPVVGTILAASPAGGFNTCEGSRATPQCLQAMSQSEGTASASVRSSPAPEATRPSATTAEGGGSSTVPETAPSTVPAKVTGWKAAAAAAASMGAALGLKSDEQRAREAEHDRLMNESARTLEGLKRQLKLPGGRDEHPLGEPGGSVAPRVDSQNHAPISAPASPGSRAMVEPDAQNQTPFSLHNPYGQHGKPDHQATVRRLKELAEREFPTAAIQTGTSIYRYTQIDRRPDVWAFDSKAQKVLKVYEAVRLNPDGSLPYREQLKKGEYDRAGIPSHFEPVTP